MEEIRNTTESNEEIEIDLSRLFNEIKKKLKFIILLAVIGAIVAFIFTTMFVIKK